MSAEARASNSQERRMDEIITLRTSRDTVDQPGSERARKAGLVQL
jgi:hypothetical protein